MSEQALQNLIVQAETLSEEERLRLAAHLLEKTLRQKQVRDDFKWEDICGIAAPSLLGEDAHAWVSRTRREGDEKREAQWRRTT